MASARPAIATVMDAGLHTPAPFLLLTGGFVVALWGAIRRRDGPATIAMATALVGTAHLAGLPDRLLVWGCTVVAVAAAMSIAALLLHRLSGSDAYRLGVICTVTMTGVLVAHHRYGLPVVGSFVGDESPAIGMQLHRQVELLVRG